MNDMSFDDDKDLFKKSLAKQTGFKAKEIQDNDIQEVGKAVQATPEVMKSGVDPQGLTPSQINEAQGDEPKKRSPEDEDRQQKMYQVLLATLPTLVGAALGGTAGAASGAEASHATLGRERAVGERQREESVAQEKEKRLYAQQEKLHQAGFEQQSKIAEMSDARARQLQKERLAAEKEIAGMKMDSVEARMAAQEPKAAQAQAATFGRRIEQAEDVFKDLQAKGFNRADTMSDMESYIPERFQGENLRKQDQAERNFVNAVLRRESGAAIAQSEFDSAKKQYFPRPGDTPDILRQKEINRNTILAGLKAEAGHVYNMLRDKESQITVSPRMIKGGGNAAIAGPGPMPDFDNMSMDNLIRYNGGQ